MIFRNLCISFLPLPLFQLENLNLFSLPSQGSHVDFPEAVWLNGFHWNFLISKKLNSVLNPNIINAMCPRGGFVYRKLCVLGRKGKEDYNGCCISTLIIQKMSLVSSAISHLCCVSPPQHSNFHLFSSSNAHTSPHTSPLFNQQEYFIRSYYVSQSYSELNTCATTISPK